MPPHCECGSQHQYFKTQFRDITQVPKAPMGENIIHAYNANWSAAGEQYWSYLYKIEYAHNWVCEFCDQEIHGNLGQGIDIFYRKSTETSVRVLTSSNMYGILNPNRERS
jgi:hypothetical protein